MKKISDIVTTVKGILNYKHDVMQDTSEDFMVYIDDTPSQPFNLNEAGWPRNDISAYELASSESEASLILQRLQEIADDSIYKNMSEAEMFDLVCPRRAYSDPVLFQNFVMKLAKFEASKIQKEMEELKKSNETENQTVNSEAPEVTSPAS